MEKIQSELKKAIFKNPKRIRLLKQTTRHRNQSKNKIEPLYLNDRLKFIEPKLPSELTEMTGECNTPEFDKTMVVRPTNEEVCEILRGLKIKNAAVMME